MVEIEAIDYLIIIALAMPTLWVLGGYIGRFIGFVTYTIYAMVAGEQLSVRCNDKVALVNVRGILPARLVFLKCKREDFGFKPKTKKEQH